MMKFNVWILHKYPGLPVNRIESISHFKGINKLYMKTEFYCKKEHFSQFKPCDIVLKRQDNNVDNVINDTNRSQTCSSKKYRFGMKILLASFVGFISWKSWKTANIKLLMDGNSKPHVETPAISRSVQGVVDIGTQKLTLYQFQSCPYCCKVRAALDYFGFAYDVVEVNSLSKAQIKFSDYKKVPILVVEGSEEDKAYSLQFFDSSQIVSVLASYVVDYETPLSKLHVFYPVLKKNEGRKTVWEFPNKYFLMFGENKSDFRTPEERIMERKWRQWTDDVLVHTISPNVYRTYPESLEAFHHFSDWGEWEKNFSTVTRLFIIYAGSVIMYFIGKIVKKRHNIKEDPRESLFDACDIWMKAIGIHKFLGVDRPNLADLAVYGALHSFEGCRAFQELMATHRIHRWYKRMEEQINLHEGVNIVPKHLKRHI